MSKNLLRIMWLSVLVVFLSMSMFAQTQTGSIAGTITDDQGVTLPGVEVTVDAPQLMGIRSFISLVDGSYRFPFLPPGRYVIKAKLTGFQDFSRPDILVSVGVSVRVDIQMVQATEQIEVVVTAPSPTIDTKSSKLAAVITTDLLENVPIGRSIFQAVQTAPSVIGADASMVSVHGAVLMQSRYVLDGADITDPLRGYAAAVPTFDMVEEVEVVLGGLSAENAKASAGFINVVSKSGGNNFSGSVTAFYTAKDFFRSTVPTTQLDALGLGNPIFDEYNYDIGVTFGGPIIKDRLWFFLNPRYQAREFSNNFIPFTAGTGEFFDVFNNKRKNQWGFAKLTAQVTDDLKIMSMFHWYKGVEEPYSWWNAPRVAWTWSHELTYKPWTLSNVLSYVIDANTFTELKISYVKIDQVNLDYYELGVRPLEMRAYDRYYGTTWGLIPWNEDYGRDKIDIDWTLTRFQDDFLGANHEIKIGAGYQWWKTRTSYYSHANYYEYWYKDTPWWFHDTEPYKGAIWIENFSGERDSIGPMLNVAKRYGFFFQDTISIRDNITLNLGLRYDRVALTRPEEVRLGWFDEWANGLANLLAPDIFPLEDIVAPEIKDAMVWSKLQPRIGLTFDPFGDGKTAIKAHYARMIDDIVGDMTKGLHPFDPWENAVWAHWWDDNRNGFYDLPPTDRYLVLERPARLNTDPDLLSEFLDPDMTAPFVDEITVGIHRELFKNFSAGVTYIYRENKNIPEMQDTNNPLDSPNWLPYTVTEPGPDAIMGTADDAPITVYGLRADAPYAQRFRTNVDIISRKYQGIEFTFNKRMSDGWQLAANLVYSKTYGNLGGGWGIWRGDRGDFMNPNQLVNRWGRTNFDRPLMIKVMGTALLPFDVILSAYYRHTDGVPTNRTLTVYLPSTINGVPNRSATAAVNAEAPGTLRSPASDYLDLRLEKVFKLPFGRIGIYVDAFNVLGFNRIDLNINNGGYIFTDGSFSVFPLYGQVNSVEGVRSFRFTLRFSFPGK